MGLEGVFSNADRTESFSSGSTIFRAGDTGTVMYGVIGGAVELHRGLTLVHTVPAGEVFGELSIIDGSPRSMTAVAVGATTLALIDREQFLSLVARTPAFALDVMESLAARMRSFDDGIR
jgi:CRP-like cAMP-binding protein